MHTAEFPTFAAQPSARPHGIDPFAALAIAIGGVALVVAALAAALPDGAAAPAGALAPSGVVQQPAR